MKRKPGEHHTRSDVPDRVGKAVVVDTNVPVVANVRSEQASPDCVDACTSALQDARNGGKVVMDDGLRILDEYMGHLSYSGQPGIGDAFFRWIWQNQVNPAVCERVTIHPRHGTEGDFEEFPQDPELQGFDRSDRKFVAVALASTNRPTILNAVDSDWWTYHKALERHGLKIEFLCREQMQRWEQTKPPKEPNESGKSANAERRRR